MRRSGWFLLCLVFAATALALASQGEERLTRLFGSEYDFWDCDWSPDGKILALAGKSHYQPAVKSRIWLYTIGTEKPAVWTNTDSLCDDWPRWSPDGKRLALVRRELDGSRRTCIWWKDVVTGEGKWLTKGPDDRQPTWAPDGHAIVFRRGLGRPQESVLAVFDMTSRKVTALPLPGGQLGEAFWGCDGRIYYTRYQLVQRETRVGGQTYPVPDVSGRLWRYEPATDEGGPVMTESFDQRMPALSPDGKWLAFYGQRSGQETVAPIPNPAQWALFLRDQATGKMTELVTNVDLTHGPPAWSRNSQTVTFYSLRKTMPALWSCPIANPAGTGQ